MDEEDQDAGSTPCRHADGEWHNSSTVWENQNITKVQKTNSDDSIEGLDYKNSEKNIRRVQLQIVQLQKTIKCNIEINMHL